MVERFSREKMDTPRGGEEFELKLTLINVDLEETLLLRLDGEAHLSASWIVHGEGACDVLLNTAIAKLDAVFGQTCDNRFTR